MGKEIKPNTLSLPSEQAIQDPAARAFARAVRDAFVSVSGDTFAVDLLTRATTRFVNGNLSISPSISTWLFRSELFQNLTREIERVDVEAQQAILAEANARMAALSLLETQLAEIAGAAAYDNGETYATGDIVEYMGALYRALSATTGNLPTNTTYWQKIGDYASLGDAVAGLALDVTDLNTRVTATESGLSAEASQRNALAAQMRGSYTGTDIAQVSAGLLFSERVARANADSAMTVQINSAVSRIGAAEAAILDEQTTRVTNDAAIVEAINTIWSITGATEALSQVGTEIVTNWNSAQATAWSTLQTEVFGSGGNTIRQALAQEATLRSNADGTLFAQYTVKVDQNGYVSGFGLASTANNGDPLSEFAVVADRFVVVPPSTPGAVGYSWDGGSYMGLTQSMNYLIMSETGSAINFAKPDGSPSFSVDVNGNALFAGQLVGATGTFAGTLQAGVLDQWAFQGIVQPYSAPGTYTVTVPAKPAGWSALSMRVFLQGSGASGGGASWANLNLQGSSFSAGGGGGAGSDASTIVHNVTPGATYTVVVPAGASARSGNAWVGYDGLDGSAATASGPGLSLVAAGGIRGRGGSLFGQGPYQYGPGGSIGGQAGSDAGGGSGGSSALGSGGLGGTGSGFGGSGADANGRAGGVGSGGGGAFSGSGNVNHTSGPGGPGFARIEFFDPNFVVTNNRYANLIAWLDTRGLGSVPTNAR